MNNRGCFKTNFVVVHLCFGLYFAGKEEDKTNKYVKFFSLTFLGGIGGVSVFFSLWCQLEDSDLFCGSVRFV